MHSSHICSQVSSPQPHTLHNLFSSLSQYLFSLIPSPNLATLCHLSLFHPSFKYPGILTPFTLPYRLLNFASSIFPHLSLSCYLLSFSIIISPLSSPLSLRSSISFMLHLFSLQKSLFSFSPTTFLSFALFLIFSQHTLANSPSSNLFSYPHALIPVLILNFSL